MEVVWDGDHVGIYVMWRVWGVCAFAFALIPFSSEALSIDGVWSGTIDVRKHYPPQESMSRSGDRLSPFGYL